MLFQAAALSSFLTSAFISFCCEISQPSNTFSCRTQFLQTFYFFSSFITSFLLFLCPFFCSQNPFWTFKKMACLMLIISHPLHPSLILSTFNHKIDINFMYIPFKYHLLNLCAAHPFRDDSGWLISIKTSRR